MTNYLVFRMYGPLASWGEIAIGESRHTAAHPSRSALLGLLAAALGIPRADEDRQQLLFASFRFGVKLAAAGSPLRDYHTAQVPPQKGKVVYRTRKQELTNRSSLGTILSSRDYRCDSVAVVAVEAAGESAWSLEDVAEALRTPVYTLYLGRKSCAPALPLAPEIVHAGTLREALDTPQKSLAWLTRPPRQLARVSELQSTAELWPTFRDRQLFRTEDVRYFWEDGMNFGSRPGMEQVRHDQPLSRRRWQFASRRECVQLQRDEHTAAQSAAREA